MMTAPTESPARLDMPSLDTSPACECHPDCHHHRGESCSTPAVFVARMAHMMDSPDCKPIPLLTCLPCIREAASKYRFAIDACAPEARCVACNQVIRCVHDFIVELVAL